MRVSRRGFFSRAPHPVTRTTQLRIGPRVRRSEFTPMPRKRRTPPAVGTVNGEVSMLSFDSTTRTEYEAALTSAAKAQAVLDALGNTVTVSVYDGSGNVKGTGLMQSPWAVLSGRTLVIGEVGTFNVTADGPIASDWYLRFEGNSRWVRGGFGTGQDFTWSLPTWETGQTGTLGTVTFSVTSLTVESDIAAVWQVPNGVTQGASGFTPEPGYSVDRNTAQFLDGTIITIAGTGFGTMGGDVIQYGRGDEGANGQPIDGSTPTVGSNYDTNIVLNPGDSTLGIPNDDTPGNFLTYSNARTRPGRSMSFRRTHFAANFPSEYRAGGFGYRNAAPTPLLYVSYWRYMTGNPIPNDINDNLKQWYIDANGTPSGSTTTNNPPAVLLLPANNTSPWRLYHNTTNGGGDTVTLTDSDGTNTNLSDTQNAWQLWEIVLKLNSSGAVSDGRAAAWLNCAQKCDDTTFRWFATGWPVEPTGWKTVSIGHMDRAYDASTLIDYSDVYVASTQARVMVGNGPTFNSCTAREIQIARNANWSNTSIQAKLNVGAFGSLSGKYLYVVKSDGTAIKIGAFN